MRKIKKVLRLKLFVGRSCRQISKSCGIARSTVTDYLNRAVTAGLSWPLPEDMDEAKLERMLYPPLPAIAPENSPKPNWSKLYKELKRVKRGREKGSGLTLAYSSRPRPGSESLDRGSDQANILKKNTETKAISMLKSTFLPLKTGF